MDIIIQRYGRTLERKKKSYCIWIMELEGRVLAMRIFHLNRIGLGAQKQIKDKFRGPDSSLFQAISPMFYIIRVFGLAPYRFSKNRLVSSNAHLLFSFSALFINTYVTVTTFLRFLDVTSLRPVLSTTERGKLIFNYVTMMIDITMALWTRNQFVKVWNIIQDFDHETYELGFPQTDKKTKFWVWVILIFNILNWLWINQTGMYAFAESAVQNLSYMFVYIGTCFSVFKFFGVTVIIGQRFKHLNKIARKCSPDETTWIANSKIAPKTLEKLRGDLMVASEKLNSLYYWSLLLWLFNLSVHAVSGMYFLINMLVKDDGIIDIPIYSCLVGWLFVHVVQLVLLHCVCDFASTEANRMGYILLNWQLWQIHHDHKQDFDSTIHLMNYKLNFSAGGCCYVNLPLLRSIVGLLTTYLVILLQLPN